MHKTCDAGESSDHDLTDRCRRCRMSLRYPDDMRGHARTCGVVVAPKLWPTGDGSQGQSGRHTGTHGHTEHGFVITQLGDALYNIVGPLKLHRLKLVLLPIQEQFETEIIETEYVD